MWSRNNRVQLTDKSKKKIKRNNFKQSMEKDKTCTIWGTYKNIPVAFLAS